MVLDEECRQGLTKFQNRLSYWGFRHFRWFRRWCGGMWFKTCDFDTYIREQINPSGRYPRMYVSKVGFVLDYEDYRG